MTDFDTIVKGMKFSSGSDGLLTIKLSDNATDGSATGPTLNFSLSNYKDGNVSGDVKTDSFTDVLALYKGNGTGADSVAGALISLKDIYTTIPEGGKFTNVTITDSNGINKVNLIS